jgi:hypothetical protein
MHIMRQCYLIVLGVWQNEAKPSESPEQAAVYARIGGPANPNPPPLDS